MGASLSGATMGSVSGRAEGLGTQPGGAHRIPKSEAQEEIQLEGPTQGQWVMGNSGTHEIARERV